VNAAYSIGSVTLPENQYIMPGTTAYYALTVTNAGNTNNTIALGVEISSGIAWPIQLLRDDNSDGVHQPGETAATNSTGLLAADASYPFFLSMVVPSTATTGQFSTVKLTLTGTPDSWPAPGDDTVILYSTTTCVEDSTPAIIVEDESNPAGIIGFVGDKIVIRATVTDPETGVASVALVYRINSSSATTPMTFAANKYSVELAPLAEGSTLYYSIHAVNGADTLTATAEHAATVNRMTVFPPSQQGRFEVADGNPDDGSTSVTVPAGALDSAVALIIEHRDRLNFANAAGAHPVAVYEFGPTGTMFNTPATLSLLYLGSDAAGVDESQLAVFWWDGYEWRYVGGIVDALRHTVSVQVMHFSLYALFPASGLTDDDYRPKEKIITPNHDGKNDFAAFGVPGDVVIKIFDVNGRLLRELENNNIWDGRDRDGNDVESGLYLYQFKVNGKLLSGMIAVAR
jgi:gliding motility-associated-like protein